MGPTKPNERRSIYLVHMDVSRNMKLLYVYLWAALGKYACMYNTVGMYIIKL